MLWLLCIKFSISFNFGIYHPISPTSNNNSCQTSEQKIIVVNLNNFIKNKHHSFTYIVVPSLFFFLKSYTAFFFFFPIFWIGWVSFVHIIYRSSQLDQAFIDTKKLWSFKNLEEKLQLRIHNFPPCIFSHPLGVILQQRMCTSENLQLWRRFLWAPTCYELLHLLKLLLGHSVVIVMSPLLKITVVHTNKL